jgi:endonuclease/exonuclease/phosphatase family metal-dependent hydrolase
VKNDSDSSYKRRILLKFDTQNFIPAGAVINSAKLYLVLKGADDSTGRPIGAYRVTKSFLKHETNWLNHRDSSRWSNAGGDLGSRYTTTSVGNAVGSTYTFDLTQLVQQTVRGDFGSRYTRVALIDTGTAHSKALRAFHSSRASNSAVRPKLVISYGSSTQASAPVSSTSGTTLRVMQYNIHHTKGSDGKINPDRLATAVAKHSPDVISMNEVAYYHSSYINDDLGRILEELLERKTGRAWYRKFINVYGGSWGYGNLVLSRFPLANSSTRLLSYRRGVVQVGIVVNGRNVNLFSTHVDYYNSSYRTIQTKEARSWIGGFSAPRIVMGDFNTNPGTSDYKLMADYYIDAWAKGKSMGVATSYNGTGATHGNSRFDYVYYSNVSSLVLKSVNVPDTRISGVFPSDHDPVVATFEVR